MRFDDEATQHARRDAPASAHDATSFDELIVEAEAELGELNAGALADEPIDDDLGAVATGAAVERRRTVVVVGRAERRADRRRCGRSRARSASSRISAAASCSRSSPRRWSSRSGSRSRAKTTSRSRWAGRSTPRALAKERHRATRARRCCGSVRARTSRARRRPARRTRGETIPAEAIDEARALAREATPERPWFVGVAGRVTSDLYALRDVPQAAAARRARDRGRRAAPVRGARSRAARAPRQVHRPHGAARRADAAVRSRDRRESPVLGAARRRGRHRQEPA